MNLKEKNIDKNYLDLTLEIPRDEIETIINRYYLINKDSYTHNLNGKYNKELIEEVLTPGIYVPYIVENIQEDLIKDIEDELQTSFIVSPVVIDDELSDDVLTIRVIGASKPEIELLDYKNNLEFGEGFNGEVSDEEIEERLKVQQLNNARLIPLETPITEDDTMNIDVKIFYEGDEVGGQENITVTLNEYPDEMIRLMNFKADDFIGKSVGDTVESDFNKRKFIATINQVYNRELPEIDDDFASEVSEFDTLDEYKNSLKDEILKEKEDEFWIVKRNKLIEDFIEGTNIDQSAQLGNRFDPDIAYYRYLVENNIDPNLIEDENFDVNMGRLKSNYHSTLESEIFNKVLEQENIEITDEEAEQAYEDLKSNKDRDDIVVEVRDQIAPLTKNVNFPKEFVLGVIKNALIFNKVAQILTEASQAE